MHLGCCSIFGKRKNTLACGSCFLRFPKISQHPACMDHAMLHGKPFSNPLFMKPSVEYLGYRVDMHGLHAIEKKVEAIKNAPAPENKQQLRSFLGMVNYYAKFVNQYSTVVYPLNELLRHNVKWKWTKKENDAFCALKDRLSAAPVLTHFRSDLPLKLDTDASNYGIGA